MCTSFGDDHQNQGDQRDEHQIQDEARPIQTVVENLPTRVLCCGTRAERPRIDGPLRAEVANQRGMKERDPNQYEQTSDEDDPLKVGHLSTVSLGK